MIAVIAGVLYEKKGSWVIVNVNGVGYEMTVTGACLAALGPVGSDVLIYTHMQIREDGAALFGFASAEEKALFQKIITVSGAGPKTALALLTAMKPVEFIRAVGFKDVKALTQVSGVGKKTAERLILELQDMVKSVGGSTEPMGLEAGDAGTEDPWQDARAALEALGYTPAETASMIQKAAEAAVEHDDIQAILKAALGSRSVQKRG